MHLPGAKRVGLTAYDTATGDIFLDDVTCAGTEDNIFMCPQRELATPPNCLHTEDVAIQCSDGTYDIAFGYCQGLVQHSIFTSILREWVVCNAIIIYISNYRGNCVSYILASSQL